MLQHELNARRSVALHLFGSEEEACNDQRGSCERRRWPARECCCVVLCARAKDFAPFNLCVRRLTPARNTETTLPPSQSAEQTILLLHKIDKSVGDASVGAEADIQRRKCKSGRVFLFFFSRATLCFVSHFFIYFCVCAPSNRCKQRQDHSAVHSGVRHWQHESHGTSRRFAAVARRQQRRCDSECKQDFVFVWVVLPAFVREHACESIPFLDECE